LILAADQFVVQSPNAARTTILAGYPWFTDWGRDTMIALPGLCLATGRAGVAREILEAFAGFVDGGMIPNRFPDHGETPDYNTVDATLWFVHACDHYADTTGDAAFRARLLPVLHAIIAAHRTGTRFGIQMDPADSLLRAGGPNTQLTWMDAKIGDQAVTPRAGKPVEINALWINALRVAAAWTRKQTRGSSSGKALIADEYDALAERAAASFAAKFVRPDGRGLYDLLAAPDDAPDPAIRPNQVLAAALPRSPVSDEAARAVLDIATRELLTPFGLRTLAPGDPAYRPRYEGGPAERDGAYHQGAVWPWLLGAYCDLFRRVHGPGETTEQAVADLLRPLLDTHLTAYGVGSLAEVLDADPPHRPNGCPWQAWSVAEVLRARFQAATPGPHRSRERCCAVLLIRPLPLNLGRTCRV
jgi:4-alpha-glucanotransferase